MSTSSIHGILHPTVWLAACYIGKNEGNIGQALAECYQLVARSSDSVEPSLGIACHGLAPVGER